MNSSNVHSPNCIVWFRCLGCGSYNASMLGCLICLLNTNLFGLLLRRHLSLTLEDLFLNFVVQWL